MIPRYPKGRLTAAFNQCGLNMMAAARFRSDVEMALALSDNDPAAAEEAYELTTFGALLEAHAPQDEPEGP